MCEVGTYKRRTIMVKIGIVGAGTIAGVIADTVNKMNEAIDDTVVLGAIASRSLDKAKAFAEKYKVPKAFGSYQEMFESDDIDLVYVATPHSQHYENAMAALKAGKHVIVEKAFTSNAEQAKDLIKFAEEKQLLITEAIWTRYQPMRTIIRDTVESGIVGSPRLLTATLGYAIENVERIAKPELAGGALLDLGVYPLNLAVMILGRPKWVVAQGIKSKLGVDIDDCITLQFGGHGPMAILGASVTSVSDRRAVFHCEDGYIEIENVNNPESIKVYDNENKLLREAKCPTQITGYEYELIETAEAIKEGKLECVSMPHEATIYMMEMMDDIRKQLEVKYPFEENKKN